MRIAFSSGLDVSSRPRLAEIASWRAGTPTSRCRTTVSLRVSITATSGASRLGTNTICSMSPAATTAGAERTVTATAARARARMSLQSLSARNCWNATTKALAETSRLWPSPAQLPLVPGQLQAAAANRLRAAARTRSATCSAWARISGTAMISHSAPRVTGPTANRCGAGWPCAPISAP